MARYAYAHFPYRRPVELTRSPATGRARVAIIGAGPVGLAMAIDLALHGIASVVLDDNDVVSVGSRAICWSKRTLEIFDRLGVGERMVHKGVTWRVGRLFHGRREVYAFDLLPDEGHKMPAFINLQQYYVEQYLVERCADFPDLIDLRWKNAVVDHRADADGVTLTVDTPDGRYALEAEFAVAADGARSPMRHRMGLAFEGRSFDEKFLIADVEMQEDPFDAGGVPERWFWFRPPFHEGQSALLHKQPDDIYRIDLQLSPDADAQAERDPERVLPRIREIVGDKPFTLDWFSVYSFNCARLERFVHDRVIFVGDAAHVVSPFGARGGNGGIQDVDNLSWKLAAVLRGEAGRALLETYDVERGHAADENIAHSARATAFMTPKSRAERLLRDAVLDLAGEAPFARRLVNSGRLSTPASLAGSPLTSGDGLAAGVAPGSAAPDAPCMADGVPTWLLERLGGRFVLLTVGEAARVEGGGIDVVHVAAADERAGAGELHDRDGWVTTRYGCAMAYLVRPDQHIAARFALSPACPFGGAALRAALDRALALSCRQSYADAAA